MQSPHTRLINPLKIMWGLDFGCGFGVQSPPHPRLINPLKIMWIWILNVDFGCNLLTQG
jgi:hypothetical protein